MRYGQAEHENEKPPRRNSRKGSGSMVKAQNSNLEIIAICCLQPERDIADDPFENLSNFIIKDIAANSIDDD